MPLGRFALVNKGDWKDLFSSKKVDGTYRLKAMKSPLDSREAQRIFGRKSTLLLTLMLSIPSLIFGSPPARGDLVDASSLSDHAIIKITNDSQFNSSNGVIGGNGTEVDPYIIENCSISASSGHGIWIENTTKYFSIQNCYIYNGSHTKSYDGIYLKNLTNGRVTNNRLENSYKNLYAFGCDNLNISDNLFTRSNDTNIALGSVSNSIFYNNTVNASGYDSFYTTDLENCNIACNSFLNNSRPSYGYPWVIGLDQSKNITIYSNLFSDNEDVSIAMVDATDTRVLNNQFYNSVSQSTVHSQNCNACEISGNYFQNITGQYDSGDYCVDLTSGSYNFTICNNTFQDINCDNGYGTGIYGGALTESFIFNNTFKNNDLAIELSSNSDDCQLFNNMFTDGKNAVYLIFCDNNSIDDNIFENNSGTCINLEYAENQTFFNNTFTNNTSSFYFENEDTSQYATFNITENNSIDGRSPLYLVREKDMVIQTETAFIGLILCDNITIKDKTLGNDYYGVLLHESSNVTIENTTILNTDEAIAGWESGPLGVSNCSFQGHRLHYHDALSIAGITGDISIINNTFNSIGTAVYVSNNNCNSVKIANNTITEDNEGIEARDIALLDISNNSLSNNNRTMTLYSACDSKISQNTIDDGAEWGIQFWNHGKNCTISNNTIRNCTFGINITEGTAITIINNTIVNCSDYGLGVNSSNNTLIYNNYFNNTDNYDYDSLNTNRWNVSRTLGWNIIGGPMLGGNYWSDYSGSDSDEDGLGDTSLPYGPGDYLPLVPISVGADQTPPYITNITNSTPTTGDNYTCKASVSDDTMVTEVFVQYWFDGSSATNASMNLVSGTYRDGIYSIEIKAPSTSYSCQFIYFARDMSGKLANSSEIDVSVLDNDPPEIIDNVGIPTTGESYCVNATVTDNINVSKAFVDYWFDDGKVVNTSLDGSTGCYLADIQIPLNSTILKYNLSAMDNSSNWATKSTVSLNVRDNDPPQLEDKTPSDPETGGNFSFLANASDNIRISKVAIEYWFDNGSRVQQQLSMVNGTYALTILVATDATTLHYLLSASDSSANQVDNPVVDLRVTDVIPPTILDLTYGTPTTGGIFSLFAKITDNIKINEVRILYWYDDDKPENVTATNGPIYQYDLTIPINISVLHYILSANDSSSNWISLTEVNLSVRDDYLPSVEDLTDIPYSGEQFVLRCRASDNIAISLVESEYWFDGGAHVSGPMEKKDDYQTVITVSKEARVLHYKLTARDTTGNFNSTSADRMIIDKIAPIILDGCGDPTTGENFSFEFNITENWHIRDTSLEYWFDNDTHMILKYTSVVTVFVPINSTALNYIVTATDDSNNTAIFRSERAVRDNIFPKITDLSGNCTTGDEFQFVVGIIENVGIADAYLDFRFDDGEWTHILLNKSLQIRVPDLSYYLDYVIFVKDTSGNSVSALGHKLVRDNDAPTLENPDWTYGRAGILIRVRATDNLAVSDVNIRYSYDNLSSNESVMWPDANTYSIFINISDAKDLRFRISARDTAGNIIESDGHIDVKSLLTMEIRDLSGNPTTGEEFPIYLNLSNQEYNSEVRIEYWYDNSTIMTVQYSPGVSVAVPDHAGRLRFRVTTIDIGGITRNATFTKDIIDNDPPVVEVNEYGACIAGSNISLNVTASDNMAVRNATIRYWFDSGMNETVVNLGPEINNYSLEILLPKKTEILHYSIIVADETGNSKEVRNDLPIITKNNGSRLTDNLHSPGPVILLLIACLIGFILSVFIFAKRKRKKID